VLEGVKTVSVGCHLDLPLFGTLSPGSDPHKSALKSLSCNAKLGHVTWVADFPHAGHVLSTTCPVSRRRAADGSLQPISPTDAAYPKQTAISRTFPRLPVTAA
jgi:hypothetical protein